MHYEGNIIRPPSEAGSILLQVTVGCSRNKCTFCGTYQGERFRIKPDKVVNADIDEAAERFPRIRRVFLMDGDALILPRERLLAILERIRRKLPWVTRVGAYANAKSLKMKTPDQLERLREAGLGILYMGLESGDDRTLSAINKGAMSETMIQTGKKARAAGMKLSVTVLLGIAGVERSRVHARETGRVLSAIDPEYIGALSLMLIPGTPLYDDYIAGRFQLPDANGMLKELHTLFMTTHLTGGLFHANHASNYLPIKARLPKDREAVCRLIEEALAGKIALTPEARRGL
jgi:radical SAM superfamily enzyme YgiQ (UPF0313 family)